MAAMTTPPTRLAAVLLAGSLLLGSAGCSATPDGSDTSPAAGLAAGAPGGSTGRSAGGVAGVTGAPDGVDATFHVRTRVTRVAGRLPAGRRIELVRQVYRFFNSYLDVVFIYTVDHFFYFYACARRLYENDAMT